MIIYNSEPITKEWIVKAINELLAYNVRIQRLQDYYEGKQAILLRHYQDSTKPNNRIVVNMCKENAEFLTAYLIGVPIEYKNAPQIILDLLNYNDNDNTTQNITLNMNIAGQAAELFYTDKDSIPRFSSVDPKEIIFVFDNTLEQNLTHAVRVYPKDNKAEGFNVTVYDKEIYTQYSLTLAIGELETVGRPTAHFFRDVPLILYMNNETLTGSFEGVMSMQDSLNIVYSDHVNEFEQNVDSFLVLEGMQGTTGDDIAEMKRNRVLLTDAESKAYWLTKSTDTTNVVELKENLKRTIRELGSIPDIENLGSFGTSGVALQFKLIKTETAALKQERALFKGVQRKMELIYNILKLTAPGIGDYRDVTPEFSRNFIMLAEAEKPLTIQEMILLQNVSVMSSAEIRAKVMKEDLDEAQKNLPGAFDELEVFDE